MNWKRFPSPWLTSADSEKKLALLWQPQLSEAATSELLSILDDEEDLLTGVQPGDYVDTDQ